MTITLCASVSFYPHVARLVDELEAAGHTVIIPRAAQEIRQGKAPTLTKISYDEPADFAKKAALIRAHFAEVAKGDAILVVNDEKHGVAGYIGPNVLMEMGLAFYLGKTIYVLNDIDTEMPMYEEALGMQPVILSGDLRKIVSG